MKTGPLKVNRRRLLQLAPTALASTSYGQEHAALLERLQLPTGKVRVIVDTDAYNEIDDAFAIAHAMRSPERFTVEAVYAGPFANKRAKTPKQGMEQSHDEILRVFDKLGQKTTALKGSTRYILDENDGHRSPASEDLIERAMRASEPIWIISLGCPTNIAAALISEPRIKEKINVVWLGGQNHHSPSADDYNTGQDYYATKTLFDSGVPLVEVFGFNYSEMMRTTVWELERFMRGRSAIADYLFETFVQYQEESRTSEDEAWSKPIWDLAATAWLVNPEWVPTSIAPSPVLMPDITWAHQPSRHPIRVSTRVFRDPIFTDFFRKIS